MVAGRGRSTERSRCSTAAAGFVLVLAVALGGLLPIAAVGAAPGRGEPGSGSQSGPGGQSHVDPDATVILRMRVRIAGPAMPGGGHVDAGLSPLYWKRIDGASIEPVDGTRILIGGAACDAATPVPVPLADGAVAVDPGTLVFALLWNRGADAVVGGSTALVQCLRPGEQFAPPAPPTYDAILRALQYGLGAPHPTYSPALRGLTGLETFGTLDPQVETDAEITRSLAFGAWAVTAAAHRAGYVWTVDGTTESGAEVHERFATEHAATAFRHTFRSRGDYELGVEVRWDVTQAIVAGPGVAALVAPLGTLYLGAARDYHVVEARGVLHANR